MVALIPAVLALTWLVVHARRAGLGVGALSWRGTLVVAFVLVEAGVLLVAEVASVGHHLTRASVAWCWVAALAVLLVAARTTLLELVRSNPVRRLIARANTLDVELGVALAIVAAIGTVLVAIAIVYPPSNTDSLMYHLPRVEQWIQNESIAHFPTHYLSQIEFAPLHELNLLHVHLLAGTDRLDGFVQLLAVGVLLAGVAEVVRLLGGRARAQVLAVLLAAAVPSLLLEATSTQNNDFAAAVGVAVVVVAMAWRPGPRLVPRSIVLGLAGGLAFLAKGSLALMVAPVALGLGVVAVARHKRVASLGRVVARSTVAAVVVAAVAVAAAAPFVVRNVEVFDEPTGPDSENNITQDLTMEVAAANVVRATMTNFRIGDGQGLEDTVHDAAVDLLEPLFDATDVDPEDMDYRIGLFDAFEDGDHSGAQRTEELGANPWHVLLILLGGPAIVVAALVRRLPRSAAILAVGFAAGYIAFTSLNRWSPFGARYQIPLLALWCAVIALGLDKLPKVVGRVVVVLLLVAAARPLLDNSARSLLDPRYPFDGYLEAYYAGGARYSGPDLDDYDTVAERLADSDCHRLGIASWVVIEYPLWIALEHHGWEGRIDHVDVQNDSADLAPSRPEPCARLRQMPIEGSSVPPVRLELELPAG